jgi:hypothetical protein
MKEHFSLKSLTFYGVMIGSVLILFKGITAYGESRLKAPSLVVGKYRLNFQETPECIGRKDVILNIEQSGIYLFGNLEIDKEKIILDGKLNDGKVSLSGRSDRIGQCKINQNAPQEIVLVGQARERAFNGEIKWNLEPTMIKLKGNLEAAPQPNEEKH